jgi:hypothetical protein
MPPRRWRPRLRREALSAAMVTYLTTRRLPSSQSPDYDDLQFFVLTGRPGAALEALWHEAGDELTVEWIDDHPGTRPWAWWLFTAPAPRRCLVGRELLYPIRRPEDWAWVWRQSWGVPALAQCRPRGYVGLPQVESQAAYLDRLGLLGAEERGALGVEAFAREAVDPFLIDAEAMPPEERNEPASRGALGV